MNNILIIRFSAFGDVIIAYHVIKILLQQNPNIKIYFLTKKQFADLFQDIERLTVIKFDSKTGLKGLVKIIKSIKQKYQISAIFDIHNSLRSRIIKLLYLFNKTKIFSFDKGKIEKHQLTRKHNKKLKPLKHTAERYCEIFIKAGIKCNTTNYTKEIVKKNLPSNFTIQKPIIGIAPFAKHKQKIYPLYKMEQVIKMLKNDFNIIIFGGGKNEKQIAEKWQNQWSNVYSAIGKYTLSEELALINYTEVFITMDSANMHLASLTDTKIISIWGATHPYLGFTPFKSFNSELAIQIDLPCRPCSVFGNKKCYRKDLACLNNIQPITIVQKVFKAIKDKKM